MNTKDYIIVRKDEKNHLVHLTSKDTKGKSLYGILEKGRHLEPTTIEFADKEVIAQLGPKPTPGTAYGCKIEPWKRTLPHDFWGDVHIFRDLPKEEKTALKIALDAQAKFFTKLRLGFFAPVSMEIRPPNGTYSGMYKYTGKDDVQDTIILSPRSFAEPNSSQDLIKPRYWTNYVICHEGFHGVWFRGCDNRIKARWIDAYHATLKLSETEPKQVIKLGRKFVDSATSMEDFIGGRSEEDKALFEACISWIKDTHNLKQDHLSILVSCGQHDSIGKMWPTERILDKDFEIPLGKYASKNPEEFFAEAASIHFGGKVQIPKNILALLEKTIKRVRQA